MRLFFHLKKILEKKLPNIIPIAIPIKNFINESYVLYHKSFLIRKTFVTAINKTLSLYGSFSYFSGKTAKEELKLLVPNNFLKFLVEKRLLKENLKF